MVYKIYPVKEKEWLRIFKKIKMMAHQTGMCIVKMDCEVFKESNSYDSDKFIGGQTTIIHLAEQQSLFSLGSYKPFYPKRDSMGRFVKNNP